MFWSTSSKPVFQYGMTHLEISLQCSWSSRVSTVMTAMIFHRSFHLTGLLPIIRVLDSWHTCIIDRYLHNVAISAIIMSMFFTNKIPIRGGSLEISGVFKNDKVSSVIHTDSYHTRIHTHTLFANTRYWANARFIFLRIKMTNNLFWNFAVFATQCFRYYGITTYLFFIHKAQVTLCRSGGPDLYDLKNRRERHGRLMKSWQHRTDILEVCSVGKRSAVMGKPVRQSFTVKLCRVGRDCGYDLIMGRFQSCMKSETSWDCRTQREGIRGQRVGIREQRMDGREDRVNITIASCQNSVTLTFSYISRYEYIAVYICLCFNNMSILMSWGRQYLVNRVNEKEPKLQLWQMGVRI